MNRRLGRLLAIAAATGAFVSATLLILSDSFAGQLASSSVYPLERNIQYGYTVRNMSNRLSRNACLWVGAPVKQTATQRCERIETSHPAEILEDSLGNQVVKFEFEEFPPFGFKVVSIQARLSMADEPNVVPVEQTGIFIRPEKYIESDYPEIVRRANTLKGKDPAHTANKIYDWVSRNIRYSRYTARDLGALHALKSMEGDCTEFMYLFVALCRAQRIPARGVAGFVCAKDSLLKPSAYHNWVEFFEAGRWNLVDPQRKRYKEKSSDYIAMRLIAEDIHPEIGRFQRFRIQGDGLVVTMNP